jgi:hypothetical protein
MRRGRKKAVAFLKKSSAKDFCKFYTGSCNVPRRKTIKSFLVLFFKKELLPFFFFPACSQAATIPFVGCAAQGAPAPTGQALTIDLPPAIASQLAIYAGEHLALLAPRGWACSGTDGADNRSLFVYPRGGGVATRGPIIAKRIYQGGTQDAINLTIAYAARYFPTSANADEVNGAAAKAGLPASAILNLAPGFKTDKLDYVTPILLDFTTPAGDPGLGNQVLATSRSLETSGLLEVQDSNLGADDSVAVFAMRTISPDLRKYLFAYEENCELYDYTTCAPNAQYGTDSSENP